MREPQGLRGGKSYEYFMPVRQNGATGAQMNRPAVALRLLADDWLCRFSFVFPFIATFYAYCKKFSAEIISISAKYVSIILLLIINYSFTVTWHGISRLQKLTTVNYEVSGPPSGNAIVFKRSDISITYKKDLE